MTDQEKIADLEKRIAFQEHLHREINPKTNSFVHWDNTQTATLLLAILFSSGITLMLTTYIIKNANK